MQCAKKCCAVNTHGVEVVEQAASQASSRGVRVEISDLEQKLPYADNSFDLIMSNQVIEHVPSVDLFMSEIYRVLKTGGSAVISTENASSWVNIAASILGWQQFSLTNVSAKQGGIGNPFALHRNEVRIRSTWTHKTIFNYRGLIEFAEVHDLKVKKIRGAGYFPLPNFFSRIDRRHSHFITILVCK
jgi:2-polyprenyl-3-methyl-5-hydroxy-6-metoxy-1,4-benzoquinol methylase